ncbi:protein phosphatase 2C domain-containing protein [Nonomuraea salmonea]|uniref:protein phosphatase 2C domain-containing protein n=1 Tax=Nonomuraea salmonea TaxID=46181 RepID=UPI0031E8405A
MFQQVTYATRPGSARPNEDLVVAGPSWIAVLDGATAAPGVDSGCVHDVAWLVGRLGGALAAELSRDAPDPLAVVLERAIEATAAGHAPSCDLANPDSPSATVALVRVRERLEYLVLGDSPVVLSLAGGAGCGWCRTTGWSGCPAGGRTAWSWYAGCATRPAGSGSPPPGPRPPARASPATFPPVTCAGRGCSPTGWHGSSTGTGGAGRPCSACSPGGGAGRGDLRRAGAGERAGGPVRGKRHDDATAAWGLLRRPAC